MIDEMEGRNHVMEDEIDLRAYVEVMLRRWWWIVGCTVVAAVAAFGVSSSRPAAYEASAVVIITEPRYRIQLEPRFQTVARWEPASETFPELAASDDVLQSVIEGYQPSRAAQVGTWTPGVLRGMVRATSGGDPSLVRLSVVSRSPQDAAGIANVWADKLIERGNDIYSEAQGDVIFFEGQAATAEQTLEQVEQALIAFEARDRTDIVRAQLDSLRATQSDYLADQRTITYLIQDIQGLGAQLAQRPGDQPASLGDELTLLSLQAQAFNAQARAPVELHVSSAASLTQKSRGEQVALLEDLVETLRAKSSTLEERLGELEPEILERQEEVQQIDIEERRLRREQNLAEETYVGLLRKLEEARIAAQEENRVFQVGSYAAVPARPTGPQRMRYAALAGVVGGMVGLGAVFAWEWWSGGAEREGSGGAGERRG